MVIGGFDKNSFSEVIGINVNWIQERIGNQETETASIGSFLKEFSYVGNREIFCS